MSFMILLVGQALAQSTPVSSPTRTPTPIPTPPDMVLTQHNNNARTGAYTAEKTLNPDSVARGFGKVASLPVSDLIYSQPLYVPKVDYIDKAGNHQGPVDMVFVATVDNNVYAFDAGNFSHRPALWQIGRAHV